MVRIGKCRWWDNLPPLGGTAVRLTKAVIVVLFAMVGGWVPATRGAAYNFATFNETAGSRPFSFTNNVVSGTISYTSSVPVYFDFTAPTGLSTADRLATLTISTTTLTPAATNGGILDQPFSTTGTLAITENGTGKNLLTMTFTGDLIGTANTPDAQLSGSDSTKVVSFTSDYLTFTAPGNSYALSLASVSPVLSVGPGGFLTSFVSDITGSFTGNAVPEPGLVSLLLPLGVLARRRRAI